MFIVMANTMIKKINAAISPGAKMYDINPAYLQLSSLKMPFLQSFICCKSGIKRDAVIEITIIVSNVEIMPRTIMVRLFFVVSSTVLGAVLFIS